MRATLPEMSRASCTQCGRPYLFCTCDSGRHRRGPGRVRVEQLLGCPVVHARRELTYPGRVACTFLAVMACAEVLALGTALAPPDGPLGPVPMSVAAPVLVVAPVPAPTSTPAPVVVVPVVHTRVHIYYRRPVVAPVVVAPAPARIVAVPVKRKHKDVDHDGDSQ